MSPYRTTDIYTAAYLRSKGLRYAYSKERSLIPGKHRVTFDFEDGGEARELQAARQDGNGTINLDDFLESLDRVKDVVFDHGTYPFTN